MAFAKGHKKKGGRKKNTHNKKTILLENFVSACVEGGMEKFMRELKKLKGVSYVKNFMQLLEYVQPKLQRTEHTGKGGQDLNGVNLSHLSFEQLMQLANAGSKSTNQQPDSASRQG